jgi:hypothetical protein
MQTKLITLLYVHVHAVLKFHNNAQILPKFSPFLIDLQDNATCDPAIRKTTQVTTDTFSDTSANVWHPLSDTRKFRFVRMYAGMEGHLFPLFFLYSLATEINW